MASISLSEAELDTWILAGWEFRLLFERMLEQIDDKDIDYSEIERSYFLRTMQFEDLDERQARRIARRLAGVSQEVREELLATAPEDSRYRQNMQVAEFLVELGTRMNDFAEGGTPA